MCVWSEQVSSQGQKSLLRHASASVEAAKHVLQAAQQFHHFSEPDQIERISSLTLGINIY